MSNGLRNTRDLRQRMLEGRAKRNEITREIRLPDASLEAGEDVIAKVRRFELGERVAYFGAPEHLSKRISERTKDYAEMMSKHNVDISQGIGMSMVAFMLLVSQEPEFEELVNTVCVAAFVDPPLVETEADLTRNPEAWLVQDLTFGDRTAVFYGLQEKTEEAKEMRKFRGETGDAVEDFPAVPDVLNEAKRDRGRGRSRSLTTA